MGIVSIVVGGILTMPLGRRNSSLLFRAYPPRLVEHPRRQCEHMKELASSPDWPAKRPDQDYSGQPVAVAYIAGKEASRLQALGWAR